MVELFSCLFCLALLVFSVGSAVAVARRRERIERRLAQEAPSRALTVVEGSALPSGLTQNPPRALRWRGGYLESGHQHVRAEARRFLTHGIARRAVVLETYESRRGQTLSYRWAYCFRDLYGQLRIEHQCGEFDLDHLGFEHQRGELKPFWDIRPQVGQPLTVLVDAHTGAHLIFESFLAEEVAGVHPSGSI